ncbi:MAG: YidC/Oxa1 family membrane protein insertase [Treponema sp.]|nr:YidC/Oxa1 family membrane protein insertase [Treponema sp.]
MLEILYTIIIYPITQIIEFVFVFAQKLFKNTGISVIGVSAAVSILCLPLYMVAERWQETERDIQKKMSGKISKIKAVFKGDEQYMILSAYYRQNHYHPVYALRSTFGLLVQIPFFIAAYSYLTRLPSLQGTTFLFIHDLGKPDALILIAGGINFLPVLMTLINCISGAVYTKGLVIKEKIQLYGMALVFLVLLYNSPSALVLYWTLNNVFSLLKNIYLKIGFRKKQQILYGLISFSLFALSYYILFVHHGSFKTRILIAFLSVFFGIIPWIVPYINKILKYIKRIQWTLKETFYLFLSSALVLWITSGIFLPSMLIAASPQEFSFIDDYSSPLSFIFNTSVQSFGLFLFWPLMIYLLYAKKIKNIFSLLSAILAFSAICNVFIFKGNYGLISKDLVFTNGSVEHNLRDIAVNTAALSVILFILALLYIRGYKKTLHFSVLIIMIAIASFSVKNIYSINSEFKKLSEYYTPADRKNTEISPIFHLSRTGNNVIMLMLDMAQSVFIPYIFEEDPELYKKFEGFVYYPNTVTFNGWTLGGAPPVFGGYEYTPLGLNSRPELDYKDKTNEALLLMPKLFSSSGFSVTITDPPYADSNWIPDLRIYDSEANVSGYITDGVYTDLWLEQNNIDLPGQSEVLNRNILWYAIFREAPLVFRQALYYTGSWCAPFSGYRMRLFLDGYAVLDNLDKLTGFTPQKENNALIMVNNTTHENHFLQAPGYRPELTVNNYGSSRFSKEVWYHVNAAAIKRLGDYFEFLKSNNVYDNTRIVIVSDHGCLDATYVNKTSLPFHLDHFNPVLMVKDFYGKDDMKTDMTFMTTADVPSIAVKGLISGPVNPFTGKALLPDKGSPQLILTDRVRLLNGKEIDLNTRNTFFVQKNIFDENNWSRPEDLP